MLSESEEVIEEMSRQKEPRYDHHGSRPMWITIAILAFGLVLLPIIGGIIRAQAAPDDHIGEAAAMVEIVLLPITAEDDRQEPERTKMEHVFTVHDEPGGPARYGRYSPQYVYVLYERGDGWVQIGTWRGPGWVNVERGQYAYRFGLWGPRELDALARLAWTEGRGVSPNEKRLIMWAVLNRVHHPSFPDTIMGVKLAAL